jgi:hypothetical protein
MPWQPLNTVLTPTAGIDSTISIVSLDPWQNGNNLPFPLAVETLPLVLKNNDAVLAIAVSATNLADFATALSSFNAAFQVPLFERLNRRADKQADLETSKFILVDTQINDKKLDVNSLPAVREAYRKQLISESKAATASFKTSNPLFNLSTFSTEKNARAAAFNALPPPPISTDLIAGAAWWFYAESDILSELKLNHPGYEYQFTVILAFVAPPADLADLKGLFA